MLVRDVVEVARRGAAAVLAAGREARVVPGGERAVARVRGEVGLEPEALGRAARAAADLTAVRVQHHDVPAAEVVAVPALRRSAGHGAEVGVVARCVPAAVFVVAHHRARARLVAAPARLVAALEVRGRPVGIGVVAECEQAAEAPIEQRRRRLVARRVAARDVAGAEQHVAPGGHLDVDVCVRPESLGVADLRRHGVDADREGARQARALAEHAVAARRPDHARAELAVLGVAGLGDQLHRLVVAELCQMHRRDHRQCGRVVHRDRRRAGRGRRPATEGPAAAAGLADASPWEGSAAARAGDGPG